MPSPNDPNADDAKPFVAPSSTQNQEGKDGHEVTDKEEAGADGWAPAAPGRATARNNP